MLRPGKAQQIRIVALISAMAGLIAAVLLTAGAATAPDPANGDRAAMASSQESMSSMATRVLHHIVEARAAIYFEQPKRAEAELRQALVLIGQIKTVRPFTRIADHIWVAEKHLDYQEPREVALDLIPIELSLADLEEVVSARRAEIHLRDTEAHLGRGDAKAAREELKQLRESLDQTEIELPLNSTERHIREAIALLTAGQAAEAEKALKAAEAGVRFVSLARSVPMAKARRALWLAMEDYSAGRHQAVEEDLSEALKWLERVDAPANSKTGQETQRLRAEISELLERESHKTPAAKPALSGYWHRTVGLVQHEAEKLYHAWRDQQSENHLYSQLIDAKLHLFFAEHELFESGDAEGARQELEKTSDYLTAAAAEASGPRKVRIESLQQEVSALGSLTADPDRKLRSRYDKALSDLRRMVGEK